jgi:hypothetical protein
MIFEYNRNDRSQFRCELKEMQCIHEDGGRRCPERIREHLPYCAAHLKSDLGLEIQNVKLNEDTEYVKGKSFWAKGLFATRRFEPGDIICAYNSVEGTPEDRSFGDIMTKAEIDVRYGGNKDYGPYAVEEKIKGLGSLTVDAACSRSVGAYANDASSSFDKAVRKDQLKKRPNNSELTCPVPETKQIFLQATARINPGKEILLDYTAEYWKGVNVMLTRKNGYPTSFRTYDPKAPTEASSHVPLDRSARKGKGQIDRFGAEPRPSAASSVPAASVASSVPAASVASSVPAASVASAVASSVASSSSSSDGFKLRYRRLHRKKSHKKRKKTLDQLLNELEPPMKHPRLHTRRRVDLDATLASLPRSRKPLAQLLRELEPVL